MMMLSMYTQKGGVFFDARRPFFVEREREREKERCARARDVERESARGKEGDRVWTDSSAFGKERERERSARAQVCLSIPS